MDSQEVRKRYLEFFKNQGHKVIDPAQLVLPNDPTTLFTSAGMQPLVPYLKGKQHPDGKRLVDVQPVLRTGDIEEVGDNRHLTFYEMIGNWSLGDYFKSEQLAWIFEFFTSKDKGLGLDPKRLYVSVFEGYGEVDKDYASIDIWKNIFETVGISAQEAISPDSIWLNNGGRIFAYSAHKNWWSISGTPDEMALGDIGGPDSEIFFDFGEELGLHEKSPWKDEPCHPNCDCGRFVEIGNSVFIQYRKKEDGTLEELSQKNVDFGGGFERLIVASNNNPDAFTSDLFTESISTIEKLTNKKYEGQYIVPMRIIADHLRATTMLIVNGVVPSNKGQGYVLRRLIRRAAVNMHYLHDGNIDIPSVQKICESFLVYYDGIYTNVETDKDTVMDIVQQELEKFERTLTKGLKLLEKMEQPTSKDVFDLYQSYGFPLELTKELLEQKGIKVDLDEVKKEMAKHQENSRTTSAGAFKGGLADSSETVTKLHTATHLLQTALRHVLGDHVIQKGQNITGERSRFDFSHTEKLTEEQIKKVEDLINEKIKEDLHVKMEILSKEEAEKTTAIHAFNEKYGDKVQIYYIGDDLESAFSSEYCGGPHVTHTGEIGAVKITKQEKIGNGVIRVYLVLA